jgi:two-component system, NarL family, response regulator
MSEAIKILIADDHPVVRVGLSTMISMKPNMEVVAEASKGSQAIALFKEHKPDITLMDLRLPDMSGIEAITSIRKEFPEARVIVLTTYDGEEDIYRALQVGAQSYLLKEMFRKELFTAIEKVYAGEKYFPSHIATRIAERLPKSNLSQREIEVLSMIAKGNSNKEIGTALSITEKTVKFHVSSILGKLSAADRTQAVMIALQRGILHLDKS